MTENEKATSFNSAGRPEVALSTHEYHTFIFQIKQADEASSMMWGKVATIAAKRPGGGHDGN
jgi:uncharacterized protein YwqG